MTSSGSPEYYAWSTSRQPNYITDTTVANNVIAEHLAAYTGHVGFDLEWQPSFAKGEVEHPVSLVQIATKEDTYLFQVSAMSTFPEQLHTLLENPAIMKVGVGIQSSSRLNSASFDYNILRSRNLPLDDVKKMYRDCRVSVLSCVDLSLLARSVDNARWKGRFKDPIGLSRLVNTYFGLELSKGRISRSNWASRLSAQQQLCTSSFDAIFGQPPHGGHALTDAANDAHSGFTLYTHLHDMDPTVNPTYYTFHAIRGRLYMIAGSNLDARDSQDILWGTTHSLRQWFASNPNYDPGPLPEPKKEREGGKEGEMPSSSTRTEGSGSRSRHRRRGRNAVRPPM